MSRYGNRMKDDLYDNLEFAFQDSHMTISEFVAMVLEMLSNLLLEHSQKEN